MSEIHDVTAILGGTVILPESEIPDSAVLMSGGVIRWVGPRSALDLPTGALVIPASGHLVLPGFIDTHVHGAHGDDVTLNGADGVRRIAAAFPQYGVTAWLPTTLSMPHRELVRTLEWTVEAAVRPGPGAAILGIHVEGPYINPKRKGAQPAHGIRDPDPTELRELLAAAQGWMRVMTLAPELSGAGAMIAELRRHGVRASMGHTDATAAEARAGMAAGATDATHLFNAMRPIHHRDPGVLGVCLGDPSITAEVIADGIHLDAETLRLIFSVRRHDSTVLITDGIAATGLPDGEHHLGPYNVNVRCGVCSLSDGTLAGSVLTMNRAVWNAMALGGVSQVDAVRMASLIPARRVGCADRKGSLEPGKDADLAIFAGDGTCLRTFVAGVERHRS